MNMEYERDAHKRSLKEWIEDNSEGIMSLCIVGGSLIASYLVGKRRGVKIGAARPDRNASSREIHYKVFEANNVPLRAVLSTETYDTFLQKWLTKYSERTIQALDDVDVRVKVPIDRIGGK